VAGTWKGSSDESEWSAGNTPGMEAHPEAHQGKGSPVRRFSGGEAATFCRRLQWTLVVGGSPYNLIRYRGVS
jgi:hypothetical protein